MKKVTKLRTCDWGLLFLTIAILVSGVQLEVTHCNGLVFVLIHIVVGLLFMFMATYHIYLHFGYSNWFAKFRRQRSQVTRILWWVSLISLITGLVAMIHWTITFAHAPIGGFHGKLGFLMIILSVGHICKRAKFFERKN